jgi:acyl carrier protein
MWELVELGAAGQRIRDQPEINEIVAVRSPGGRRYVLVEQQGFAFGPVLRDIVLDELEDGSDVAVAVVRAIPRSATGGGEVDAAAAVALARSVAEESKWVFAIEPPETGEERAIADLLQEILHVKRLSMTDSLVLLGADSLVMVEIGVAIRNRFGVTVTAMDLFEADSIRDLARLVAGPVRGATT